MTNMYVVPDWFFGIDILMEIIFAIVAFSVAFFSYKVYRLCAHRESKLFSASFFLISLSYLIWALINIFLLKQFDEKTHILSIGKLTLIGTIGIFFHIIFFLLGLVTLAYMTLKKKDGLIYSFLISLIIISLSFSYNKFMVFYAISAVILIYLSAYYLQEYLKRKNKHILFVSIAFAFLVLGNIGFIFSTNYYQNYVIAHIFELVAYALILINLILTIKK